MTAPEQPTPDLAEQIKAVKRLSVRPPGAISPVRDFYHEALEESDEAALRAVLERLEAAHRAAAMTAPEQPTPEAREAAKRAVVAIPAHLFDRMSTGEIAAHLAPDFDRFAAQRAAEVVEPRGPGYGDAKAVTIALRQLFPHGWAAIDDETVAAALRKFAAECAATPPPGDAGTRPPRKGWAPGAYLCRCRDCTKTFTGDKRAVQCADCAYAPPGDAGNFLGRCNHCLDNAHLDKDCLSIRHQDCLVRKTREAATPPPGDANDIRTLSASSNRSADIGVVESAAKTEEHSTSASCGAATVEAAVSAVTPPGDAGERARALAAVFTAWLTTESNIDFWSENNAEEQLAEMARPFITAAASQARREALAEFISAARSCARFRCAMTDDIPICPDCGATTEGDDQMRGVCQADAIRQIRADAIEVYLRRALATPQESAS